MSQQHLNYGTTADDGTGDTLRTAAGKIEDNFNELYAMLEKYWTSTTSSLSYDSGTSGSVIPGSSLTIPASNTSRTFMVWGSVSWNGHAQGINIMLDGTKQMNPGVRFADGGDRDNYGIVGPWPVTVPGDNASHTIGISGEASGSTGAVTWGNRSCFALRVA